MSKTDTHPMTMRISIKHRNHKKVRLLHFLGHICLSEEAPFKLCLKRQMEVWFPWSNRRSGNNPEAMKECGVSQARKTMEMTLQVDDQKEWREQGRP